MPARHSPASAGPQDRPPIRVGFLLVPQFALMSYASSVEPLRAANRLSGHRLYVWRVFSPDGEAVRASSGVTILPDHATGAPADLDLLLVIAAVGAERFEHPATLAWLRTLARRGTRLGGVSGGPYLLARAGVLAGYRCTLHWEYIPGFVEQFPSLDVTGKLYEIDRDRLTCSGGVAALDMMHVLIEADHGAALAAAVSEQYMHTAVRRGGDPQRMSPRERLGITHPKLLAVAERMGETLESPLSRESLAALAGISVRQLERLFRDHLGSTIHGFYLDLRLQRARRLLQLTPLSVLEIAVATGFVSASHFSRAYSGRFGLSPRAQRRPEHADAQP